MAAVASEQANRQMTIKLKQKLAAEHHKEKLRYQQATNEFRRAEEERAAKIKHEIYIRERKAVHDKYKVRFPPREKWASGQHGVSAVMVCAKVARHLTMLCVHGRTSI